LSDARGVDPAADRVAAGAAGHLTVLPQTGEVLAEGGLTRTGTLFQHADRTLPIQKQKRDRQSAVI